MLDVFVDGNCRVKLACSPKQKM